MFPARLRLLVLLALEMESSSSLAGNKRVLVGWRRIVFMCLARARVKATLRRSSSRFLRKWREMTTPRRTSEGSSGISARSSASVLSSWLFCTKMARTSSCSTSTSPELEVLPDPWIRRVSFAEEHANGCPDHLSLFCTFLANCSYRVGLVTGLRAGLLSPEPFTWMTPVSTCATAPGSIAAAALTSPSSFVGSRNVFWRASLDCGKGVPTTMALVELTLLVAEDVDMLDPASSSSVSRHDFSSGRDLSRRSCIAFSAFMPWLSTLRKVGRVCWKKASRVLSMSCSRHLSRRCFTIGTRSSTPSLHASDRCFRTISGSRGSSPRMAPAASSI
mmetsp:Transcript_59309/g.139687  ORF Transcript_59309/g.139687 Transcript_59309/m.139687 type:complete len:332 (+) Transcript_59309:281-1276(+)